MKFTALPQAPSRSRRVIKSPPLLCVSHPRTRVQSKIPGEVIDVDRVVFVPLRKFGPDELQRLDLEEGKTFVDQDEAYLKEGKRWRKTS